MRKYLVSWNESITCYVTVEARNEESRSKALNLSYKDIDTIDMINSDNVEVEGKND